METKGKQSPELSSYLVTFGGRGRGWWAVLKAPMDAPSPTARRSLLSTGLESIQPLPTWKEEVDWGVPARERHSHFYNTWILPLSRVSSFQGKNDTFTPSILELSVRKFSLSISCMSHYSGHQSTQVVVFALGREEQSWKRHTQG